MFRYVALIWNDVDAESRKGALVLGDRLRSSITTHWETVVESEGLTVLCRDVRPGGSRAYRLHGEAGAVLGTLFERGGEEGGSRPAPAALSEDETQGVLRSAGRRLVERYWGRYVAVMRDARTHTTWVLRDPTSGLPCFHARILGVDVFFSNMEEGALLGGREFTVNWKYVVASLCQNRLQVHATGLNEVSQVLGGECATLHRGTMTRQFYWNAIDIAATPLEEDASAAARRLRTQTRDCVQAWTSGHRSIVHLLSGGLDSSIILACLRDSPISSRPRLTCLNFHSPGSNTDEREYARLAATGTECEMVERPRNPTLTLEPLLQIQTSCIPGDNFFYLDGGRAEAAVAAEKESSVVFSGYGGDQLFYQARARYAAADYVARHGIGPGLFTVALDAARVDRLSIWSVLRDSLVHGLFRHRWAQRDEVGKNRPLLRQEVIQEVSGDASFSHPWLQSPGRVSSGKLWHAYQLLFPIEYYNPLGADSDPEPVTPLFSQPLLELALRIPTWLLTIGGWDRALARRAFQHDVPRPIVTRRTKGGQEEHAKSILVRNLQFARDLLLQGRLIREGILDADRVADVLSGKPTRTATTNVELFACLSVEAWLRQWRVA